MKLNIFILIIFCLCYLGTYGQQHNMHWVSGNTGDPQNDTMRFGGNVFDFNGYSLVPYKEFRHMNFLETMGVASDSIGKRIFYTNGTYIANVEHDTMKGGGPINPGYWADEWTSWGDKGYRYRDGIIVVPDLNLNNHYRLFHVCGSDSDLAPDKIMTTLINMEGDNGLGEVIEQNTIIYDLQFGRLSQSHFNAVRHANGRDWWLVSILYPSEALMLHLYTPDSIYRFPPQPSIFNKPSGVGQCQFSPDGTKFASGHVRYFNGANYEPSVHYYHFDRCIGQFTPDFADIQSDYGVTQVGVVFSASSRYLYQTYGDYIFRFDTEASDIKASKDTVAIWDGFISYTPGGVGFEVRFGYGELGPDSVVYSNSASTTFYMHKIEEADAKDDFMVTQHFKVPAIYAWTVPNHPNYFLGPLEGSDCAQMFGPPVAFYDWNGDELDFTFSEQCVGVPTTWSWDFGDGTISSEQHPLHTYLSQGTYTVCLTAANLYGADTHCKELIVETSSTEELFNLYNLMIHPNPATDYVDIRLYDANGQVHLLDISGKKTISTVLKDGRARFSVAGLPAGTYTIRLLLSNGQELNKQLVIQ